MIVPTGCPYVNDSGMLKFSTKKERFKERFKNAYSYFQKGGMSSSLFLVHTSMTIYKMNCSKTWSLVFHQWSIPSESGTKSKTGHSQKFISVCQDIGIAKDMNTLAFPSCSFIWRHLSFSKYQQVWFTSQARKQQTLHTTLSTC